MLLLALNYPIYLQDCRSLLSVVLKEGRLQNKVMIINCRYFHRFNFFLYFLFILKHEDLNGKVVKPLLFSRNKYRYIWSETSLHELEFQASQIQPSQLSSATNPPPRAIHNHSLLNHRVDFQISTFKEESIIVY